ncbi:MAG: leucine-rich repeat protein, partial [Alistipes sp.]|nr:leucine-rich repeat protein [Alistipes sp.]
MKNILRAIMSLLLFVACTTTEESPSSVPNGGNESVTPSITLEHNYLNFDEHADVQTISFSSTMDWTAELINDRADGWCSISATSGTAGSKDIDVTVTENTSTDDRTASVIIKSGAISKTVRISQKQRDALTVTSSTFEIEGTSGKIYIEVKANVDFEYTINGSAAEWITPIETRAMKTTTLGFNIAENKTMQRREGTITIHSGDLSETVTVYQKDHGDAILLSQNEYVVSDTGEDIAVEVTSNVDVEIEMPDVDWITRNTSRAVSTNTYYFTIAENTTYDQREAYITFKNTEKKISERVKVSQVQKDAIVLANSEYEIEMEGGRIECEILANVDIQVDIPQEAQEWITHVETRALQTNYLVFEIASYDDIDSREALITLSGGDATQTITIRQLTWQNLEDNKIYYTSSDGQIVEPYSATSWGDNTTIISNTYENGQGVIVFSRNLTEIGSWAFQDNGNKFTSITLPKTLKKIGYQAFLSCSQLTEIEIPNSVTSIDTHAFAYCTALTEVTLGENLETIGDTAFIGCTALTNITIPDKVKYIGYESFKSCANLTEVTLGSSLESIGENAFLYCGKLESITIPDSVTSIGSGAFQDCYALASVTFGRGLETIGDSAFAVCNSLTNITIPDNVKWLGNNAFNSCENLAKVNIGDGVETIGSEAFRNCAKLA